MPAYNYNIPGMGSLGQYYTPLESVVGSSPTSRATALENAYNIPEMNKYGWAKFLSDLKLNEARGLNDLSAFDQQAQRDHELELARIRSGQDYWNQWLSGSFGTLNNILGKGYIDQNQHAQATGRYAGVQQNSNALRGNLNEIAGRGLFTDTEWSKIEQAMGPMMGNAQNLATTGGLDENYDRAASGLNTQYGNLASIWTQGGDMTPAEVEQVLAAAGQDVEDAGRAAAANTFNATNISGTPFAAQAILADTATEAAKNRARTKADVSVSQAQSRRAAASAAAQVASALGQLSIGKGQNRIAGQSAWNQVGRILVDALGMHAGGRMDANKMLLGLLDTDRGIAGDLAKIDMSTMPDFVKGILADLGKVTKGGGAGGPGTMLSGGSRSYVRTGKNGETIRGRVTTGPWTTPYRPGAITWA
jgi:hypothetical protein